MTNHNALICPCCGSENIQGDDECGSCLHSLVEHERSTRRLRRSFIARDRVAMLPLTSSKILPPTAPLREALALMQGEGDACVLVVDDEDLVGIMTERDVLCRVAMRNLDPDATPLSSLMTPDPIRVWTTDRVCDAFNIMSLATLRHLPVMKGEKLAGHVTPSTLLAYLGRPVAD